MDKIKVTARIPANKEKGTKEQVMTVEVPFAATAKEAIQVYGDEAVLTNARANAVVSIQALMRSRMKAGKTAEEVAKELSEYKMGVSMRKTSDPIETTLKKAESMSDEQLAALIAKLQSKVKNKAA